MRNAIFFVLACAAALTACGPQREKEPNDDFDTATPIKAGRVLGTLSSASDVDFYRVDNAEEPAVLFAHLSGIRGANFVISIFDKDRHELKRYDETAIGGDEDVTDIGLPVGPTYIKIWNKNPQYAPSGQDYTLDVKIYRGPGHEREPDDSPDTASPLELPGVTRGHYYPSKNLLASDTDYAEVDWYKIDITQSGLFLLNIDVSDVSRVDPVLEIYDSNGYKIKEVDTGGVGQGESLRNFGVRGPVTYFMRLRAKDGGANPDQAYEVLTELIPYQGNTEFEPNDQRVDATPFAQDQITGTIAPAGDVDWYKVSVTQDEKQLLRANLSGVEGLDSVLQVADSLGNIILTVDNGGRGQPETLTGLGVTKGDYYLIVSEKSGRRFNDQESYTLTKTLVPWQPGLEYELNDSTATAQFIKVGDSVDGYVGWKGDVDYYTFNVYSKGTLAVELAGVLNVQPMISLFDQDGKKVDAQTAAKPGDSLSFQVPVDSGTYALRLEAAKPEENNVRDKYTLRLKLQ